MTHKTTNNTSRIIWTASLLCVAGYLFSGCGPNKDVRDIEKIDLSQSGGIFDTAFQPQQPISPDTTIAIIGETEITQGQLDMEVAQILSRGGQKLPPERIAQMRQQLSGRVLDGMITQAVLLDAANNADIPVSDAQIEEKITEQLALLPDGTTREDFLSRTGMTEETLREEIAKSLRITTLIDNAIGDIAPPTEEEKRAAYDENPKAFNIPEVVTARHILCAVNKEDDEQVREAKKALAEEIRQELLAGADFAALASEKSDCPSSERGGLLGTFPAGRMVPEFDAAAFSQEVGAIGEVVETPFGYHIILVEKHEDARAMPYEEVQETIGEKLIQQQKQKAAMIYIEELKTKANIEFPGKQAAAK